MWLSSYNVCVCQTDRENIEGERGAEIKTVEMEEFESK
jgi:hypothetical protein